MVIQCWIKTTGGETVSYTQDETGVPAVSSTVLVRIQVVKEYLSQDDDTC